MSIARIPASALTVLVAFCAISFGVHSAGAADATLPASGDGYPMLERPWPAGPDKFDFIVVGDKTSGGEYKWPVFDEAIREINLLRPDFAIMVGDLIPGHMIDRPTWESQWEEFWQHGASIKVPFLFLPGNHDISNPEMYRLWQEDYGQTYYSFDYMGCHFIAINTEEERFDGRGEVWNSMIDFVRRDLAQAEDARHTFLFMHKPMWRDSRYANDWTEILSALGTRRYSAFAGHWHTLELDDTLPGRHMVVAATGGGLRPSPLKELGRFDHYTKVTVDGDSVYLAIVEPNGPIHSEAIARRTQMERIESVVSIDAAAPRDVNGPVAVIETHLAMQNPLDDTIAVTLLLEGVTESGWRTVSGAFDSVVVQIAPGDELSRDLAFSVPRDRLAEGPSIGYRVEYLGHLVDRGRESIPIYPESAMRAIPNWSVIGPMDIGNVETSYLPDEPTRGLPGLFEPDRLDVSTPDGFVIEKGDTLRWQDAHSTARGLLNFNGIIGTEDHALGYALATIVSPRAQEVLIELSADNFAQVMLNGKLLPEANKFGTPGEALLARIPLREGSNALTVKLVNNRGDWWLRVRIADPYGELRFDNGGADE